MNDPMTTDTAVMFMRQRNDALNELAQWRANHDEQVRRKQHVQAMYEEERARSKRLLDALIAMDEAVCHGSPETAKRIAREAVDA